MDPMWFRAGITSLMRSPVSRTFVTASGSGEQFQIHWLGRSQPDTANAKDRSRSRFIRRLWLPRLMSAMDRKQTLGSATHVSQAYRLPGRGRKRVPRAGTRPSCDSTRCGSAVVRQTLQCNMTAPDWVLFFRLEGHPWEERESRHACPRPRQVSVEQTYGVDRPDLAHG